MTRAEAFKELGLTESASDAEIRSAYRKLALKHHPDVDPTGAARMAAINAAHDRLTRDAKEPDPTVAPPPEQDPFADWGEWENEGSSSQGNNSKIGQSIYLTIDVPWEVANLGRNHVVSYKIGGKAKKLTVKIPKGSASGKQIRCAGRGEPGANGGIAGDLYLTLNVVQNTYVEDIRTTLSLWRSETNAPCVRDVNVVVDGHLKKISVRIPANVRSGQTVKVSGVGNKSAAGNTRGDILVKITVKTSRPGRDIETYANVDAFLRMKMALFKGANVTLRDVNTDFTVNPVFRLEAHHRDGERYYWNDLGEKGDPGEDFGKLFVTPRYTEGARQFKTRFIGLWVVMMVFFIIIGQSGNDEDFATFDAPIEERYETPTEEPAINLPVWPPSGLEPTTADYSFAYGFYEPSEYSCTDETSESCIVMQVASERYCTELGVRARFYDSETGEEEWVESLFYEFEDGTPQDIELNVYTRFFDTVAAPEIYCSSY
jgi:hypothetical protein